MSAEEPDRLPPASPSGGEGRAAECVRVVLDLVKEDRRLLDYDRHAEELQARLALLSEQVAAQRDRLERLRLERRQKRAFIWESADRLGRRTVEANALVSSVWQQVDGISRGTVQLSAAQRNTAGVISTLSRFASFVSNLEQLEADLRQAKFDAMGSVILAASTFEDVLVRSSEAKVVQEQTARFGAVRAGIAQAAYGLFARTMEGAGEQASATALAHAAMALDSLGGEARDVLIKWYCSRQLRDYTDVFRRSGELATLEALPKRYAWLRRLLRTYGAEHGRLFPDSWRVDLALCVDFCTITSRGIVEMLGDYTDAIDLALLREGVQGACTFERQLQARYRVSFDSGLVISNAFESSLFRFIEAHDGAITRVLAQLPAKLTSAEYDGAHLLKSAPTMFLIFREVLKDISTLSIRRPLLDICTVFTKHLVAYQRHVQGHIPAEGVRAKRDGTKEMIVRTCILVNTLDYCQSTTGQMAEVVIETAHPQIREAISFDSIRRDLTVACLGALHRLCALIAGSLETIWISMEAHPWATIRTVGDQSEHIHDLATRLQGTMAVVGRTLVGTKHYIALCDRLVTALARRFHESVCRVRPMSEVAAHQLLVDLESLRNLLTATMALPDVPLMDGAFRKLIVRETLASDHLLKAVLTAAHPIDAFVSTFVILCGERSEALFRPTLACKGIRRSAMAPFVEELHRQLGLDGASSSDDHGSPEEHHPLRAVERRLSKMGIDGLFRRS